MSGYRDEIDTLRARTETLEAELAASRAAVAERDARLEGLRRAMDGGVDGRGAGARRWRSLLAPAAIVLATAAATSVFARSGGRADSTPAAPRPATAAERAPVTFAVVVDTSSAEAAAHWPEVAGAITAFAGGLRDDDRLGIVQHTSKRSSVVQPIETVASLRPSLAGVLRSVHVGDPWMHAPYGSVSASISAGTDLLRRTTGDARVILFTDGNDASWGFAESSAGYSAANGFRVSAVGVGSFVEGYPQSVARAGHGTFADLKHDPAAKQLLAGELGVR